ncbi:MAG: hypothetical protein M1825_000893 [Sarcosagium campestre]|nr:MAG: hypothetical protein M1825_000893 [Sarcosagium campestre]
MKSPFHVRSPWRAASVLAPALAGAMVLPGPLESGTSCTDNVAVLETNNHSSVKFSVPCPGCFNDIVDAEDKLRLTFNLDFSKATGPCGSNDFLLDGQTLSPSSNESTVWNQGPVSATGANGRYDIVAQWASRCISDSTDETDPESFEATTELLFFIIKSVGASPIQSTQGFLASLKLLPEPEMLRIGSIAHLKPSDDASTITEWTQSPSHVDKDSHESTPVAPKAPTTEDLIRELNELRAAARHLEEAIKAKERLLGTSPDETSASFKAQIRDCDGFTCTFNTILDRALTLMRTSKSKMKHAWANHHYSHHHHHHHDRDHSNLYAGSFRVLDTTCTEHAQEFSTRPLFPVDPDSPSEWDVPSTQGSTWSKDLSRFLVPFRADGSEAPLGRHHSAPKTYTEWLFTPQGTQNHSRTAIHLSLIVLCVVPICLYFSLRRRCCCTRAERRWQAESRRNARSIRRARHQQALRSWWRKIWVGRDQSRITDYEEKRSMVMNQESVLEDAMQTEIRDLRRAAGVISAMVSPESGRSEYGDGMPVPEGRSAVFPPFGGIRRQNSFPPDYRSESSEPPPIYDDVEEGGDDTVVADGFQYAHVASLPIDIPYTPSGTDSTPDSSVYPTSVRSDSSME